MEGKITVNNWSKFVQKLSSYYKLFIHTDIFSRYQQRIRSNCYFCYQTDFCRANICPTCLGWLPWMTHCCRQCGLPMPMAVAEKATDICIACMSNRTSMLDAVKVLFRYEDPVRSMILNFKYHEKLYIGKMLGTLMAEKLRPSKQIAGIMPIPLSTGRLKQRGFNQSLEIAQIISKKQNMTLIRNGILKLSNTKNQSELSGGARSRNIKPSNFECVLDNIPKSVILVDDVMTTGATMGTVAQKLRLAGVQYIEGWVICRAIL